VEILMPETFVPSRMNPSAHDDRTLGLAVASITLLASAAAGPVREPRKERGAGSPLGCSAKRTDHG
jgi:hypothetical protein